MMKNVFVVDDDVNFLKQIRATIGKDFNVTPITIIARMFAELENSSIPLPDLILLDIIFPGNADSEEGVGALRKLKANSRWKDIPVVMCSSFGVNGNDELVKMCFEIGAREMLFKDPNSPEMSCPALLINRLRNCIQ